MLLAPCNYQLYNTLKVHCMKSVQIRSFFWPVFYLYSDSPNTGKGGTEKTPYLDPFHAVASSNIVLNL